MCQMGDHTSVLRLHNTPLGRDIDLTNRYTRKRQRHMVIQNIDPDDGNGEDLWNVGF